MAAAHEVIELHSDDPDGYEAKRPRGGEAASAAERTLFRLTTVHDLDDCYNVPSLATSLREILSLDRDAESTVHFNYKIDLDWLLAQYPTELARKPILIVGHHTREAMVAGMTTPLPTSVTFYTPRLSSFGTHHTKMIFIFTPTAMRVAVSTANLIHKDWSSKTQGVWVSGLFPRASHGSAATSASTMAIGRQFGRDLCDYLAAYGTQSQHGVDISSLRHKVAEHDFSSANARIIASVPGAHAAHTAPLWGHLKLRKVLSTFPVPTSARVIAQFSSFGSLGATRDEWLGGEFTQSLAGGPLRPANSPLIVFPSVEDVRTSSEGYEAGLSLPHSDKLAGHNLTRDY